MTSLFIKLLILPTFHFICRLYLARFRRNIKAGDSVGIKFGEQDVHNRVVIKKSSIDVSVKGKANEVRKIKLEDVYLPDFRVPKEEV